jgi:hypothetical protein
MAAANSDALLEAVRALRLADPDLNPEPLLAKLREQQPDLGAGTREVREAALTAATEAAKATASQPAADDGGPMATHLCGDDCSANVRVRSREGEEVICSREAAHHAATLHNMIEDSAGGIYPLDLPVVVLRAVLDACNHDDSGFLRMASHSLEELVAVMVGANYLDAPGAFSAAARQLTIRFLAGKSAEELRTNLVALNDMSEANQAAAVAEPTFTPPPHEQAEQSTAGRGATEDLLEAALREADATTLYQIKAVSTAWHTRAYYELCDRLCESRLCDRLGWRELWGRLCQLCHRDVEGQSKPTRFADITDLDVECLQEAKRLWGVVMAGRQQLLPKLARLHGYGFVVDVQAVRQADLQEDKDDDAPLGGAALRSCIEGEGEPPHELLLAAVACAASGTVRGVPVQRLRKDDAIDSLELNDWRHRKSQGVISVGLLGLMLPAATSVRSLRCVDGATPL